MLKVFSAFAIGLVFGIGILISGMVNPAKVLNFFDIAGTWDPSLMFVMGGALIVTALGYAFVLRLPRPLMTAGFQVPTRRDLDARLFGGSAIFGIGWGLSGFCPGGLVPALGLGRSEPLIAALAIVTGILTLRVIASLSARQPKLSSS